MLTDAASVQGRAARLVAGAGALAALGVERRAASLARAAAALLARASSPEALGALAESSGLGLAAARWALETTLETADVATLTAMGRAALAPPRAGAVAIPARLCAVVLSGNVLTAPVRALAVPLLVGAPVLAKASSRDDALARLFADVVREVDPEVGDACDVVTLAGDDPEVEALYDQADVVSVYGSDATVRAVRAAAPATAEVIGHGHGLGVGFVDDVPSGGAELDALARAIADDVAAYDQRGCLSPHAVVVRAGEADARRLAEALHAALATLARDRPRGALPIAAGSAQLQWRGVAAARGELLEGDGFAVSVEGDAPIRLSPGYRNVAVHRCDDRRALVAALRPFGVHLKALGVAGDALDAAALARALPAPLAPRISPLGTMQRPPFDALADARPATYGLVRFADAAR